ncbi:MAG TPA: choice-of-anchor Q domain-containing protein [Polyangiaceae bacterium]|nr:choice-of-anchor Q domain-containing protein [Polyangiaceae bacterium]
MTVVDSNHFRVRGAQYGGAARHALGIFLGLGLGLFASSCKSTVVIVTTTADGQAGSLRAAIASINADSTLTDATIQLVPGTYELTVCGSDDSNALGDLDVVSSAKVVLESSGSAVIRQTCAGERVLDAHGTSLLTLRGISVTGGSLTASGSAQGGGLRATGDVTLERARILDNSATTSSQLTQGGGLYVAGALRMYDSVVARNTAAGARANEATREIGRAEGGGAYVGAAVVISGSTLSDNVVSTGRIAEARGGGIAQSLATEQPFSVVRTRLENNQATGGDFSAAEGGAVSASGALTAAAMIARGNRSTGGPASGAFGGPAGAARGGAFAARSSLRVTASTFNANLALGGVAPYMGTSGASYSAGSGSGGAVWAMGALTLTASTFTQNTAEDGAGHLNGALSGGGAAFTHATLDATNTTFSGNAAIAKIPNPTLPPYYPGGLSVPGLGAAARALTSVQLRHATIANNSGGNTLYTPLLSARASVALASSGRICSFALVGGGASDYNRFGDATCSLQGVDNQQDGAGVTLEPLADNGGPAMTHLPGGTLIDAIPTAACALPDDARGVTRPQGSGCDVGAVEIRPGVD